MKNDRSGHEPFNVPRLIWDALLVTAMLAFWLALSAPAGAQDDGPPPVRDYVSCGHFETQADAQAVLDSGTLDENGRASLDGDGDGVACEEAFELDPDSPPPARDYVSCGHFDSQESAQEALDSGLLDENGKASLDSDGDGIVCEIRWGEPASGNAVTTGVTTLPKTGSGSDVDTISLSTVLSAAMALTSGTLLMMRKQIAR